MDSDYYVGFDDATDRQVLDEIDRQNAGRLKRTLWTAASTLALAALAVGAYVAAPSSHHAHTSPSSAVLLSDQYSQYSPYNAYDTPTAPTTPTDAYNNELPEGRAVKCGLLKLEVFRYTNGQRRWYPTPAIAFSWDPSYLLKFSIVDCNKIPRGADMTLKLPSPSSYSEGQAIKCDPNQAEVYRLTGGKRCWYPTGTIAASWDSAWTKFVVVDCSSLPKGEDMQLNPKVLPEGQAIKCSVSGSSEVFRLIGGRRCRYPTPEIALTWDKNYAAALVVDCTVVTQGPDLSVNPKTLPDGQAIKCSASAPEVYRLVAGGKYRWYPNPSIATSWDANWSSALVVDCSVLVKGDDMCQNPKTLPDGQAIKCSASAPEVYRLVAGGKYRWYPNPSIATSWDANWSSALVVDCSVLVKGDDMCQNPKTLPDGQAIKCSASAPEVYRLVTGGKYRWYPNPSIATSWDANWSSALVVDCSVLVKGDDMCQNPKTLPDGQAIKCSASAPEVYRLVAGGKYRWYPNPSIATSWDANWSSALVVDCSVLVKGDDMCQNPKTLPDGQAIKCSALAPEVYRLVAGGKYRWYPNPSIATSWDANWSSALVVDCSVLVKGDDMCQNPKTLPDGQAIKCSASAPEVYRLVAGGKYRWYPNPSIATSWDANWSSALVVDCSVLVKGDDMCQNPKTLPDGQAIKCSASAPEVYRLVAGGKYRWYPNPSIATSWDANWSSALVVDCSVLVKGDDMCQNPKTLPDGQAIKCSASAPEVYRLVAGGKYRWYPNPSIATSWDANWSSALVVDCSVLVKGDDMCQNPKTLPDGQAIKCSASAPEVYRLVAGGKYRWYPNPSIATSWDANWSSALVVDCSVLVKGDDMCQNPKTLPDGQAIKCSASAPEVYRLVAGGKYRWYPNPSIATSWDANWSSALMVDCSVLVKGDDMYVNPKTLPNGKTIKCQDKLDLYRIENMTKRLYPTLAIATSWDAGCLTDAIVVDCSVLDSGADMGFNQPKLVNGQAIKCLSVDASKVFRFCDELVRWYPTPAIADSWDADWKKAVLADCSNFKMGPDMAARVDTVAASAY